MTSDKLEVTFKCKACGGTALILHDSPTDNSIAKCQSCGIEIGRWGDIKAQATKVAAGKVNDIIRNAFAGKKGWTIK